MDSEQTRNQPSRLLSKLKTIHIVSILALFLAISYSITNTNQYKIHSLRSKLSQKPNIFHKLLAFLQFSRTQNLNELAQTPNTSTQYGILWMAPFLSGGGYSSESWSYILALHNHLKNQENPERFKLCIEQHGDLENVEFWEGLPLEMRRLAVELYRNECRMNQTIVVCHSEPGAWYPPLFETLPCPPTDDQFKAVVGRTMFETDRVSEEHVRRCNKMDFVWVPTDFHVDSFVQSGVDSFKVRKIVQPVDLVFFDPAKYEPLDLKEIGSLVLGSDSTNLKSGHMFVFLSVFKWEYRKGWDVLLRSYLEEFSGDDAVALYLLTNAYHTDSDFENKIVEYVEESGLDKPSNGWARVYVIDDHIAQIDLPRLYKAVDAFVLPSRGEGWGRPLVEAMAISLPVIATNWSGPTEYLTDENSYPLPVGRVSEVKEGPFKGHLWAEPSVDKLRLLMRHVISNPEEGKAKGRQARDDMMRKYSPEIVAQIVISQLEQIIGIVG